MKLLYIASTALCLSLATPALAHIEEKVNVCHHTESETNPWVAQQVKANELESHLDNGDFLYEGPVDNKGKPDKDNGDEWCEENVPEVTPTPTPTPTVTPTQTEEPTPTPTDEPTPTPTEEPTPTPTDEPTPTPTEVIATVTPTPTPDGPGLPDTGANTDLLGLLGTGLIGAGLVIRKLKK